MTDEPRRSATRFALAAGAGAGALTLAFVGGPSLAVSLLGGSGDSFEGASIAALAAAVACAIALLAFVEERAADLVARGRVLLGFSSIVPAALLAVGFAFVHSAWASAVQEQGFAAAPSLALQASRSLGRGQQDALVFAALLPAAVAMTRAARTLTPAARVTIGATTLALAFGTITFTPEGLRPRPGGAEVQAVCAGLAYFLGTTLGDRFVPTRDSTLPLHALVLPFVIPVGVCSMVHRELGPLATLPVVAWVAFQAVRHKRAVLRSLSPASGADSGLPSWFEEPALAVIEADLLRHGLRRAALLGQHGDVLGIAVGDEPTVALIFQTAPIANVSSAPSVAFFTWFADGRAVTTCGHAFDALAWLTRSPAMVHDALPGAAVDDLAARHAADVGALARVAGAPTGPGSVERYLAHEAESGPALRAKVRRVPALWLLACAWWFHAPRPVRLRGPLPA